jgi:hypothetical protein
MGEKRKEMKKKLGKEMKLAMKEISDLLKDRGFKPTRAELEKAAKAAITQYDNDEVRAECWNVATDDAVMKLTGSKLD